MGEKANVSNDKYFDFTDADFVKEFYGDYIIDENGDRVYTNSGTPENVTIKSDTIIGETSIGSNGRYISTPKSLMVTKSLILGNAGTSNTHIIPGRTLFPNSNQYKNAMDEYGLTYEQASACVSYLDSIKNSLIWIAFIDTDKSDEIRVRLRSRFVTINELGQKYEGGGHACAAGATVHSIEQMEQLLKDADALLKEFKETNEGWL